MCRFPVIVIAMFISTAAMAQTVPAQAEPVPPGIDRALWCASAFYWLAGSAEDSGDAQEAELYDGWSTRLLELASAALTELDTTPEDIEALIATYDQRALEQLGTNTPSYDVALCPDLLEAAPAVQGEPAAP